MVVSQIYRHRKTTGQMQATMTSNYGKLQIFHPIVDIVFSFPFGLFAFFNSGKKKTIKFSSFQKNQMSLWCRLVTRIIVISVNYITSHAQKREFSSFVTVHVCKKNWKKNCARECGFRNPGNFFFRNQGSGKFACWISGIPLKESGIPRTFSVHNLSSNDKELKSGEWNP